MNKTTAQALVALLVKAGAARINPEYLTDSLAYGAVEYVEFDCAPDPSGVDLDKLLEMRRDDAERALRETGTGTPRRYTIERAGQVIAECSRTTIADHVAVTAKEAVAIDSLVVDSPIVAVLDNGSDLEPGRSVIVRRVA